MIEKPCDFCGVEIYWNKYDKKFYETNSGIWHDKIACENTRNMIKTGQDNIIKTEQEVILENVSLQSGYKTINKKEIPFPVNEPTIRAVQANTRNINKYPDYNKLKIDYFFCVSCHKDTEFSPHETVSNIIKCLVCGTIQLRAVVTN